MLSSGSSVPDLWAPASITRGSVVAGMLPMSELSTVITFMQSTATQYKIFLPYMRNGIKHA